MGYPHCPPHSNFTRTSHLLPCFVLPFPLCPLTLPPPLPPSPPCSDLSGNSLSGPLPAAVSAWAAAQTLQLGGNALSGALPSAVSGWISVKTVGLSNNQLSGALPPQLAAWTPVTSV